MALKALEWSLNHLYMDTNFLHPREHSTVVHLHPREQFPRGLFTHSPGMEKIGIHIQNRYCLSEQAENVNNDHFALEYGTDPRGLFTHSFGNPRECFDCLFEHC
jgi:hypothetical protein